MRYGDVVLASTKGQIIPNAIKWFTKSQFSHSFITTPDVLSIPMCIEAAEGGVNFTEFEDSYVNNKSQGYEVWNIKISQDVKDKAIVSILKDLEIGYGFLEYPWFVWRRLCLLFGRDIKAENNWNTNGMICSQLCVAYLKACGLAYMFEGYGNGAVAPQDLQNIFKSHPELFEKTQTVRL